MKLIVQFFCIILSLVLIGESKSIECFGCQALLEVAEKDLGENATVSDIIDALDKVCQDIPLSSSDKKKCEQYAKQIADTFGTIPNALNHTIYSPFAICSIIRICTVDCCLSDWNPEQIHLAFTSNDNEMMATWITLSSYSDNTQLPTVIYGTEKDLSNSQTKTGNQHTYHDAGWVGSINTVVLTNLKLDTVYYYKVGNKKFGFSTTYSFNSVGSQTSLKPITIGAIGDMGNINSVPSIEHLKQNVKEKKYDFLLHIGDISYADGYQVEWDTFMRDVTDISANLPYMTIPGNHEIAYDFASYRNRYTMPNQTIPQNPDNQFWSKNYGYLHVVGLDTESEFDVVKMTQSQIDWVSNDLKNARMMHRPMYCSTSGGMFKDADCVAFADFLKVALEKIFFENKVDLVLQGHKHNYERTFPVYESKYTTSYNNAKSPVYVVNGAAGNREGLQRGIIKPIPGWSAVRIPKYGYMELNIYNHTTLNAVYYEDQTNTIVDSFTITKS